MNTRHGDYVFLSSCEADVLEHVECASANDAIVTLEVADIDASEAIRLAVRYTFMVAQWPEAERV